jgi:hypothetical protein
MFETPLRRVIEASVENGSVPALDAQFQELRAPQSGSMSSPAARVLRSGDSNSFGRCAHDSFRDHAELSGENDGNDCW